MEKSKSQQQNFLSSRRINCMHLSITPGVRCESNSTLDSAMKQENTRKGGWSTTFDLLCRGIGSSLFELITAAPAGETRWLVDDQTSPQFEQDG
jgi:hypothetical protein